MTARTDYEDPANSATWAQDAVHYRSVLRALGHNAPDCLPGEPEDCGGSYAQHVVSFLGAIKARVVFGINHLDCSSPANHAAAVAVAESAFQHWIAEYEEKEGCGRHA